MRTAQKDMGRMVGRLVQHRRPVTPAKPGPKDLPDQLEKGCLIVDDTVTEEQLNALRSAD